VRGRRGVTGRGKGRRRRRRFRKRRKRRREGLGWLMRGGREVGRGWLEKGRAGLRGRGVPHLGMGECLCMRGS
jgi:hypothetical protein